ncbi:hypothetical protein [Capillimicrobium parvum]|uniref:Uncharacterized protein n=1 Tax=Capillimicrobium parvum TaxID=2884022 RepID=A0A9E6XXL3_9ACTN|nr:hypothetical protein [Capillimicrobium parvum]UGS36384.1 hypothetical protein DSM104329_02788 [Capillimicrobium parvum]
MEQRLSIVRLLIALFVARIVVTVAEIAESRLTVWSVLISVAIGVEAWRAWRVRLAAKRAGLAPPPPPADSVWNRILTPVERVGPAVLYVVTVLFVVATVAMVADDQAQDRLLNLTLVVREITTFLFVAIFIVAALAVRAGRAAPSAGQG